MKSFNVDVDQDAARSPRDLAVWIAKRRVDMAALRYLAESNKRSPDRDSWQLS